MELPVCNGERWRGEWRRMRGAIKASVIVPCRSLEERLSVSLTESAIWLWAGPRPRPHSTAQSPHIWRWVLWSGSPDHGRTIDLQSSGLQWIPLQDKSLSNPFEYPFQSFYLTLKRSEQGTDAFVNKTNNSADDSLLVGTWFINSVTAGRFHCCTKRVYFHTHSPGIHTRNEMSTRKHRQFFVLFCSPSEALYAWRETGLLS